ncbi:coil containing protein [Vibrio phage 1.139.A._10N.261.48.C6]|nr:coil containing protein [Vibrio phage 1.034.O._10N.261.46.B7]AUR83478.1 coil containing protein [Vibrio phage 1.034.X._10N.261.46.B7]AUR90216.1 coil containing protein [Vibrio phage 1.139.A._10N.261.48.C6]AUR90283.1 coil containing protein [Vibrio phage 1.139.B._10N.261.48.C6]AUR95604.1 coil containing protein [Vibrio phage 1.209.O._10N.222.52.B2]
MNTSVTNMMCTIQRLAIDVSNSTESDVVVQYFGNAETFIVSWYVGGWDTCEGEYSHQQTVYLTSGTPREHRKQLRRIINKLSRIIEEARRECG